MAWSLHMLFIYQELQKFTSWQEMQTLRSQLRHPLFWSPFVYPHIDKSHHLVLAPCHPITEKKNIYPPNGGFYHFR
jgi:hypothetical protein